MIELAEFTRARVAEDEQGAAKMRENEGSMADCGEPHDASIYISESWQFDADRLRAECEAKRRIIDRLEQLVQHLDAAGLMMPDEVSAVLVDGIGAELALPYAGHPDWREEWRP